MYHVNTVSRTLPSSKAIPAWLAEHPLLRSGNSFLGQCLRTSGFWLVSDTRKDRQFVLAAESNGLHCGWPRLLLSEMTVKHDHY